MERRTALATAAAITMGATAALFTVGAGTGAFGSAAATASAPAVQTASAVDQPHGHQLGFDRQRDFRRALRRPLPCVVRPEPDQG